MIIADLMYRDPVHPGKKLGSVFKSIEMPEYLDECVLQHIIRILMARHLPADDLVQPLLIPDDQLPEPLFPGIRMMGQRQDFLVSHSLQ